MINNMIPLLCERQFISARITENLISRSKRGLEMSICVSTKQFCNFNVTSSEMLTRA